MKYYKEQNNQLIEAPINFIEQDGTMIFNFNINEIKLLEYGYKAMTDQEVEQYYSDKEKAEDNIELYRFSKLKVKEKLVELNLWNTIKNSLTDDEYENLLLANDLAFDNEIFIKFYNQLKQQLPNINEILKQCII